MPFTDPDPRCFREEMLGNVVHWNMNFTVIQKRWVNSNEKKMYDLLFYLAFSQNEDSRYFEFMSQLLKGVSCWKSSDEWQPLKQFPLFLPLVDAWTVE